MNADFVILAVEHQFSIFEQLFRKLIWYKAWYFQVTYIYYYYYFVGGF